MMCERNSWGAWYRKAHGIGGCVVVGGMWGGVVGCAVGLGLIDNYPSHRIGTRKKEARSWQSRL